MNRTFFDTFELFVSYNERRIKRAGNTFWNKLKTAKRHDKWETEDVMKIMNHYGIPIEHVMFFLSAFDIEFDMKKVYEAVKIQVEESKNMRACANEKSG